MRTDRQIQRALKKQFESEPVVKKQTWHYYFVGLAPIHLQRRMSRAKMAKGSIYPHLTITYLRMDLLFSLSWYTDDKDIVETSYNGKR